MPGTVIRIYHTVSQSSKVGNSKTTPQGRNHLESDSIGHTDNEVFTTRFSLAFVY